LHYLKSTNKKNVLLYNILITAGLLFLSTVLSLLLYYFSPLSNTHISLRYANIALLYILALVLIGRYTDGYLPGIIASVLCVIFINYLFTYPYFELNFFITGYPVTFLVVLAISIITSTTTTNMKKQAFALAEKEKIVMEAEKEKMRATLLRSISHDLRTPLTGIIGSSSSLINDKFELTESERRQLAFNIYEDANWLLNMVENILSVTRIQGGDTKLKKKPEPIEEVISESVMRLRKRLPTAQINTEIPDNFMMINMDALLIEQVIINLLENAVKHSKSTKPIRLYTTIEAQTITVHVRDYGIGIPSSPCDGIFDICSSSATSRTASVGDGEKGFGIGLSICKTIILAHDGEIHAINHKDGSEFYFSLPKEG
jgi:two-component system sensor histidine kinase KdpD